MMSKNYEVQAVDKQMFASLWRFLYVFIKPIYKKCLFCVVLFTASIWLWGIMCNKSLQQILDNFIQKREITAPLITYFSFLALGELLTYLGKLIYAKILPQLEVHIRLSLFWYVQFVEINYFYSTDSGSIENTIDNAAEGTREAMEDIVSEILPSTIFLLISVIFLFLLNPVVGLLNFFGIVILGAWYFFISSSVMALGKKTSKFTNERTGTTVEMLQNIKLSKILQLEGYVLDKMYSVSKKERDALSQYFANTARAGFFTSFIPLFLNLGLILFVAFYIKNTLTPGKLIYIMNVLGVSAFHLWTISKQTMDVFLNVSKISQSIEKLTKTPEEKHLGTRVDMPIQDMEIKNLCFGYGQKLLIKNFSLKIPFRTKICVMGASGTGKTTLLNLLSKFLQAENKMIFVDGVDVNEIKTSYFRSKISYISQSNFMFNCSIFENIAIGKQGATEADVIEAAKKAGIHDFINTLPQQYSSTVGVNSSLLSGGQFQRVCIARAIINDGHIVFCDEPTSSIDSLTAIKVIDNILKSSANKTLIWVDHSTFVAPLMDKVIFFESECGVVKMGSHEEILLSSSEYRQVFQMSQKK